MQFARRSILLVLMAALLLASLFTALTPAVNNPTTSSPEVVDANYQTNSEAWWDAFFGPNPPSEFTGW